MGDSKKGNRYSIELKKEVCEYSNNHNFEDYAAKFGLCNPKIISKWRRDLGYPTLGRGVRRSRSSEFKHEVCQYYDNHTHEETVKKFGISEVSLFRWRRELGYRNKSRGYNLYMEGLQPTMQKREVLNFKSVRSENGDMKFELVKKEKRIKELEMSVEKYDQILSSIRQLFN